MVFSQDVGRSGIELEMSTTHDEDSRFQRSEDEHTGSTELNFQWWGWIDGRVDPVTWNLVRRLVYELQPRSIWMCWMSNRNYISLPSFRPKRFSESFVAP
ncbi:hypothetical protein ANTRET_LOCUS6724 [Anthophora retusa]